MLFYGRVAEWPIASVLKTEVPQGTGGSNPSSSVLINSLSLNSSQRFIANAVNQLEKSLKILIFHKFFTTKESLGIL